MDPEPVGFSFTHFFSEPLFLTIFSGESIISLILVFFLLCLSALISGSEVAYFSLTHNDLDDLKKENGNSLAGERVLQLMERPAYLLATILITNNFINIGIIVLSAIALQPLEMLLPGSTIVAALKSGADAIVSIFGTSFSVAQFDQFISFFITVVAVTFFLVLFGEVSPKVYAKLYSMKLAKLMSRPLLILRRIFYPFSSILVKSSTLLEKRFAKRTGTQLSAHEIDQAIELTIKKEQGSEREVDILKSIIKFNNISVKEIMRSRVDVKAVEFGTQYKKLLQLIKEWGYSRVPIYDEDFDNITGILHVKDLLAHVDEKDNFEWQALINPSLMYTPESKKINDLLKEFQERRQHMAIVVDEYGGSSGIITLEDVMEEVIGEIRDEFDTEREIDFIKINAYTYIFEGKTMLNDISKLLDIDISIFEEVRGESDSIAGLLLEIFGYIPAKGKSVSFEKYKFEIEASSRKRIEKIKMTLPH